jgi:hypothetical protein
VAERAAALGLAACTAALEYVADLSARAGAAIDCSSAAVRPDAAAAARRGAGPPLTAAAAAGLDIAQLSGFAPAAVLRDAASIGYGAALDLGCFAQIAERHAALTAALTDATAAACAALQHLPATVRDAPAHDRLVFAALGDASVRALAGACVVVRAELRVAGVWARVDWVCAAARASVACRRNGPAAASGKQRANYER